MTDKLIKVIIEDGTLVRFIPFMIKGGFVINSGTIGMVISNEMHNNKLLYYKVLVENKIVNIFYLNIEELE